MPEAPPPPDPQTVRQATEALLEERRFREGMGLARDEDVRRFIDVLWGKVASWVGALIQLQESNPLLYWLLVAGLAAVASLMIWHIVYSVRRSSRARTGRVGVVGDVVGDLGLEDLRGRYRQAVERGDLATALQLHFVVEVATVIGVARLRSLGHMTYRELLTLARVQGLTPAVTAIEETVYGGQELAEERFWRCVGSSGGKRP